MGSGAEPFKGEKGSPRRGSGGKEGGEMDLSQHYVIYCISVILCYLYMSWGGRGGRGVGRSFPQLVQAFGLTARSMRR